MTHNDMVKDLLESRPYVKIADLRGWANYRSHISDCRKKFGMDIRPLIVTENGQKYHAYTWVRPEAA